MLGKCNTQFIVFDLSHVYGLEASYVASDSASALHIQCESKKSPLRGPDIFHFFHKRFRIFNRFFTTYYTFLSTLDYKFLFNLFPILTKLCHIKRDYPVHIICSKCPQSAETHALTRLRKSLIALLIVVCGK